MRKRNVLKIILILIIFILLTIIIIFIPKNDNNRNIGKLIINEIMTQNTITIRDKYGKSSDYIELYNGYDYDINLSGYHLSDNLSDTKKWVFPNITIKKNEYLLIYASGKNTQNDTEIHTNFKLNSNGETIILSDNKGSVISKVTIEKTYKDTSYGYNGKEYVYYYNGTPNSKNNGKYSNKPITVINTNSNLKITEYMTNNSNIKSSDGSYYSLIELYNDSNTDIDLLDFYLSDDENNITKYKFPEVKIKAKDYQIIYLSGKNENINNEIHTNFLLDDNSKVLIISDPTKRQIDKINLENLENNLSCGLYENNWYKYSTPSFGETNQNNYIQENSIEKDIIINEVSAINPEAIELKNITDTDINLSNYSIGDKSGYIYNLPNIILKANSYLTLYGSNTPSYTNNKIYTGISINNTTETIYLYKDKILIDIFNVNRLISNISTGLNNNNEKVYYKEKTLGKENSPSYYLGYTNTPTYSINGGYVEKGTKIQLETNDNSTIYYTLDGSFPTINSIKYEKEITIDKTTVVKAVAYKDNYIESEIVSRTFFVGRKHDVAVISISSNNNDFYDSNGLLTNYESDIEKKINFEYYEANGNLGITFIGGTKLTGMDSRKRDQKSMAIYLRKEYGQKEITYPFFENSEVNTYSSFTLRNAGEDPFSIRIQDTVLTNALKGQMDIDIQDYKPVVVYINGKYYGLYNLREKLNGNYIEHKLNAEKGEYDLIKYKEATKGTTANYNNLISYIQNNDITNKVVYEYLKTQIDIQELCNYLITESYYGNTDLGNIRYYKTKTGKWRWMLYDLDWSLWNTSISMSYTVLDKKVPAATYLSTTYIISRNLYKNSDFKDLYLKTLAYHLKNTFVPERMHKIIDDQSQAIRSEMPYHINRWNTMYSSIESWNNNLNRFKNKLTTRYNYVLNNLKTDFNLTDSEYNKYFGDL